MSSGLHSLFSSGQTAVRLSGAEAANRAPCAGDCTQPQSTFVLVLMTCRVADLCQLCGKGIADGNDSTSGVLLILRSGYHQIG